MRGSAIITKIWIEGIPEPLIIGHKPSLKKLTGSLAAFKIQQQKLSPMAEEHFDPGEQIPDPVTNDTSREPDASQIGSFPSESADDVTTDGLTREWLGNYDGFSETEDACFSGTIPDFCWFETT
jgi:hypothetical protein